MILSAQSIRMRLCDSIRPFSESKQALGMSYGLSHAGYDIRLGSFNLPALESVVLRPNEFILVSSLEWMSIPNDIIGRVHDKSTLARHGLALQNTILEPGWFGHITLEISNHSAGPYWLRKGQPIAQVIFELLDQPTERPYKGKYQDQPNEPVQPKYEE